MPNTEPTLAVFRHASDNARFDCGRACAQSIISSLTQGVPVAQTPTPAEKARPVSAATQDQLRQRESYPSDITGGWFSHPDELVEILNKDPGLQLLGHVHWKVGAYGSSGELFENLGLALQRGFPAILSINEEDHWVTVRGVDRTSGVVSFLYMLDPLNPALSPGPLLHTYYDGCAGDGTTLWEVLENTTDVIDTWELPIGNTLPDQYKGKHVAIIHEPPQPPGGVHPDIRDLLRLRRRMQKLQKRPKGPTPPLRIREELQRVAEETKVDELVSLVAEQSPLTIRYVHDIEAKLRGYTIASFYSERLEQGLVGIFDFNDQKFRSLRLTGDRQMVTSLAGDSAEPLWWTRHGLETLFSPYFPFRREKATDGRIVYRRQFDDSAYEPPPPEAESKPR